jgi:hypothetical protein
VTGDRLGAALAAVDAANADDPNTLEVRAERRPKEVVGVIQKTAKKMSDGALDLAAELPMRERDRALIDQALAEGGSSAS